MNDEKKLIEYLFLPIAMLYYIVALLFLIIGVTGLSIALRKKPLKLFKLLHRSILVSQTIRVGGKEI